MEDSPVGSVFEDMHKASTSMYICMGMALVWSIIYIYLLSWFAEVLAWLCVLLIQLGLLAATLGCLFKIQVESKKVVQLKKEKDFEHMDEESRKEFD